MALLLTTAFLRLNGVRLLTRPGELAEMILDIAVSDAGARDETVARVAVSVSAKLVALR